MVMHVELQATCSALGYQEGDTYVKEPDCLETVKDLIRFLKREDDTLDIRRQLGHAQILQNDLVPILKQYHADATLFETVLRCLVFVDEELFGVLSAKIGSILKLDWEHRQEEDKLLLERLLILIRNVLHIPPNPNIEQRTDDDASIHDQILWVMHVSGLEDMLLYIASSDEERQLCMHMLEIISLMFREQTPEILASAGMQRSQNEKEKDERELELVRLKEIKEKRMNMLKHNTRHSRFGGTYVVLNMKSISDRDLIYHKSQGDIQNLSLDLNKKYKKKAKNLAPIKDTEVHHRSTLSIRLCLKEFIVQFLENCYNPLMFAVKDNLQREKTQDHDETYYLWAMRFFMEFCRLHSKRVDLVSETLSVTTFHYIYNNLLTYYEMITSEKKEAITWSKRVHLALKAYQELLMTLDMMDRSRNPQLMESSKVVKSNIFYMMEFRDIFVTLLKRFNQTKQSRSYLKDLVESTHLFLKMLDHHSRQTHLVVQKKKTRRKKKKEDRFTSEPSLTADGELSIFINNNQSSEPSEQELEDSWDEISDELSALVQGHSEIPADISPFDAASEVEDDQQRAEAMIKIQDALRGHRAGESVALLRAAREVWPERNDFGSADISPEDEFMALREIFMTHLPSMSCLREDVVELLSSLFTDSVGSDTKSLSFLLLVRFADADPPSKSSLDSVLLLSADTVIVTPDFIVVRRNKSVGFVEMSAFPLALDSRIPPRDDKQMFLAVPMNSYPPPEFDHSEKCLHRPRSEADAPVELEGEQSEHEVEEEEIDAVTTTEQSFDFKAFLHNFAKGDILKGYGLLLADFETNTVHTNHCVLKMMHRIAVDLGYPAMIFQASIFRVFQKILLGPYAKMSQYQELVRFAMYIIRRFTEIAENNKKIFMEMLFWKDKKESLEITDGYGSFSNKVKNTWTEDQQEELLRLYEMFRENEDPEKDTVDLIMERFTDPTKRRGHIISELKKLNLITSAKDLRKKKASSKTWTEEEEFELADLYETHKNSDDPVGSIISELSNKRSKNKVIEKLISCGLVQDRKDLYKKRRRSNKKKGSDDDDDDDDVAGDGYDEGDGFIVREDDDDRGDQDVDDDVHSSDDNDSAVDSDDGEEREVTPTSPSNAADSIRNLVTKGYREQIGWIQIKLRRTADDREQTGELIPVPIVPLTEENETAMEDSVFTDFLQRIGLAPPSNEQEAFWRVPGNLTASDLRNIADGLQLNEAGEPIAADKITFKTKMHTGNKKVKKSRKDSKKTKRDGKKGKTDESKEKESKKKKAADRMKMFHDLMKKRKEGKRKRRSSDSDRVRKQQRLSESDDDTPLNGLVNDKVKETAESDQSEPSQNETTARLKPTIDSDSDSLSSEDERSSAVVEKQTAASNQSESGKKKPAARVKRMIDSDSDRLSESDDDTPLNGLINDKVKETAESDQSEPSQNETTARLKPTIDSDSDSLSSEDERSSAVVEKQTAASNQSESGKKKPAARVKRMIDSDSDRLSESDDDTPLNVLVNDKVKETAESDQSEPSQNEMTARLKPTIDSDSDSMSSEDERSSAVVEKQTAASNQSESGKKKPAARVKRMIDSDSDRLSESDDDTPLNVLVNDKVKETAESDQSEPSQNETTARLKPTIDSDSDSISSEDESTSAVVEKQSPAYSPSESRKKKTAARSKRMIDSDSDRLSASEDEDKTTVVENKNLDEVSVSSQSESMKTSTIPRLKRMIDSDSDSDDDRLVVDEDQPSSQPMSKRPKLLNAEDKSSEATFPATMLSQLHDDSDSDIDDHVPLRRALHRNCIQSDDDDNN
ncbi:protein timeless homolog [Gigantopelta aegis]|uniref:protein timeless homolog n=1 Tax=Gigantopelta aegis TaxID=1735272 RepID=UPI001B887444|nr:protein timeless homolog [Gigantopelta aegis]